MNPKQIEEAQNYIKNNVAGILERMTVSILENKPENVAEYMVKWLDEEGEETQKQCLRKIKNRPIGVESSDSEQDEEVDSFEMIAPQGKQNQLKFCRNSVSAEVYGQYNSKTHFKPRIVEKDQQIKNSIHDLLLKSILFSNLENKDLDIIINAMEIKKVKAGEQVIKQGDDGFELYIVGSGQMKCTKSPSA